MKNQVLFELREVLSQLNGKPLNPKFAYALTKNETVISKAIEDISSRIPKKEMPELQEYHKKRREIQKKYAKKDDKGNFITHNGAYEVEDINREDLGKEIETLRLEYKETLDEVDRLEQMFKDILALDEFDELNLYKVSIDLFPSVTLEQMGVLKVLLMS